MKTVDGKVAFITGGANGIGLGMARVFARAGMQVVIGDIRDDHLAEAERRLRAEGLAVRGVDRKSVV